MQLDLNPPRAVSELFRQIPIHDDLFLLTLLLNHVNSG